MAHADPKGSAEAAVRHLFRHLGNAEELRRNPLASSLFDDADRTDRDDAVAIERLRWFIAEAAARFVASACNAGALARERRARQERMVIRCGLEGASPKQVAAEFGLSKSRFYRDYWEICTEIARALQARAAAANAVRLIFDRAAFQLERAGAQAEAGDYDAALRTYDDLLRSGPVPKLRVETICRQVELELERGNYAAARRGLDYAVETTAGANGQLASAIGAAFKARLALLHSKLAWATADFTPAAKSLEAAQRYLKPFLACPTEATTLSLIETLLERGDRESAITATSAQRWPAFSRFAASRARPRFSRPSVRSTRRCSRRSLRGIPPDSAAPTRRRGTRRCSTARSNRRKRFGRFGE